jgi:4'-phosphopantetheinyl transferase
MQPAEVDVWLIHLPESLQGAAVCLSRDESDRAARFIFDRDRARFSVAHTGLRDILSRYTLQAPAAIELRTGERGKPYLADYPDIRFNLSHSGCWAMVAVARGREVGVDIECIKPERSTGGIAERFFAPAEVRELMETPEEGRVSAFFSCWSRKEAYIKARGEGLHIPLDSFEVSLGEEAVLRHADDRGRWSMCALQAPAGYSAALVVEGSGFSVRQLQWPSCVLV